MFSARPPCQDVRQRAVAVATTLASVMASVMTLCRDPAGAQTLAALQGRVDASGASFPAPSSACRTNPPAMHPFAPIRAVHTCFAIPTGYTR